MKTPGSLDRRHFLRSAALTAAGTLLGAYTRADTHSVTPPPIPRPRPFKFTRDLRDALTPRRVTNAMWDFSWLTQHYPGGAFADFDQAAAELVERRFNTVRIDAYPLVIGALRSEDEIITIPADPLANWGMSDRDREHAVVRELIEFMRAMKRAGIYVILSSWGRDCREYPDRVGTLAKDRDGFRQCWERTLDLLAGHDLLDPVLYVDLDQEFPYFSPYQAGLNALAGTSSPSRPAADAMEQAGQYTPGSTHLAWNPAQLNFVRGLFTELLPHFQARYPRLRFTYSLTSFHKEVRSLGLELFDVLELHLWIHSPRFDNRSGFNAITKDRGARTYRDYAERLAATLDTVGPMLVQEMGNKCAFARDWGRELGAPVITTEAWGPWWHMDHPDLDWTWLREWCEQCMILAAEHEFWGVTPWNYSHPYWKNWSDAAWYRKANRRFLRS